jgi:hypothetical protein
MIHAFHPSTSAEISFVSRTRLFYVLELGEAREHFFSQAFFLLPLDPRSEFVLDLFGTGSRKIFSALATARNFLKPMSSQSSP